MGATKERQPDTEDEAPPPSRPRRQQKSKKQSSVRFKETTDQQELRNMKDQQNLVVKGNSKSIEDRASQLAQRASVKGQGKKATYNSQKWEQLVSKQEELMGGDTKPERHYEEDLRSSPDLTPPALTNRRTSVQEVILPGAFRMRPSLGPAPADGLEEGDRAGREFDSRRTVTSIKEETQREADDILLEATLVSEDTELPSSSSSTRSSTTVIKPEPELVMGEPMSLDDKLFSKKQQDRNHRSRRIIIGLVCLLVLFLLVAGIVVGLNLKKQEDSPQGSVTLADRTIPTMAPTSFVEDLLPMYTQEALKDPATPQAQAYDWYLNELPEDGQGVSMEAFFPLQRFVLATFYYSLRGNSWKDNEHWLEEGTDPCDWHTTFYGSICASGRRQLSLRGLQQTTSSRRSYQRLSLYKNNLVGTLPPELGLLTKLDVVNLHGNAISGSIPSQLGLWQDVTLLQLFNNTLTGTLPTHLGQLRKIRHLNFAFNKLTGTIPVELNRLSFTLEVFSVSNNQVSGTIPTQLGTLSMLEGLHLYENPKLSGPLPSELGLLTRLQKLQLNGIGQLTGTVPEELGGLVAAQEIQLHDTKLRGPIPSTLGMLSQLTKLTLHNTDLTGVLPLEVCLLVQIGVLKEISVDCDKVRCRSECRCNCHASTAKVAEGMITEEQQFVVEAITDPPITVTGSVPMKEQGPQLMETSAAVGAQHIPRERPAEP